MTADMLVEAGIERNYAENLRIDVNVLVIISTVVDRGFRIRAKVVIYHI